MIGSQSITVFLDSVGTDVNNPDVASDVFPGASNENGIIVRSISAQAETNQNASCSLWVGNALLMSHESDQRNIMRCPFILPAGRGIKGGCDGDDFYVTIEYDEVPA